jgi:hypothetical protein
MQFRTTFRAKHLHKSGNGRFAYLSRDFLRLLPENMKLQKRLPYYNLITALQRLPVPGQKSAAAIYECAVGRSEVFDEELAILIHDSRVTAGDFCLRIILIEVDIGKYAAVSIPPPYVRLGGGNRKFLTDPAASLYDQLAAHLAFTLLTLLFIRSERIGSSP